MAEELNLECTIDPRDTLTAVKRGKHIDIDTSDMFGEHFHSVSLNKQAALDLACFLLKEAETLAD